MMENLLIGLLSNEQAFIQYLRDCNSEGILDAGERKKLFDLQHTHGMEYNALLETTIQKLKYNTIQ